MLRMQARCATIATRAATATARMRPRFSSTNAQETQAASAVPAAAAASPIPAAGGSASAASAAAPTPPAAARSPKEKLASKAASASPYSPIKGTHDALPLLASRQRACESLLSSVASSYLYSEIRTPILERTELFQRTLGEASDVVSKEMFAFEDHGTNTVLRPENTASQWGAGTSSSRGKSAARHSATNRSTQQACDDCTNVFVLSCVASLVVSGVARALIHSGLISTTSPIQRYWYCGPMFRRERPQAGRYRQFLQFGVELLATDAVAADVEVIHMASEALHKLGLLPYVQLQINTLGDGESRAAYVQALTAFLEARKDKLSEDSRQRLARGSVLRILDSKEASDQALLAGDGTAASPPAPLLSAYLSPKASQHFQQLQQGLHDAGIRFTLNPFLVRGLDYYAHVCFEFVLDLPAVRARIKALGKKGVQPPAQGTVLAGGRYDGLFATLGWPATSSVPAVGWAAGIDRLLLLEEMVQPSNQLRTTKLPAPVGVVLIPDSPAPASGNGGEAAAAPAAVPAGGVTLPQAYSALCSFVRDGCRWPRPPVSASAPSSPYCVVQSFHVSMSKQLKYCTRTLGDGRGPADQVCVTLMLGSTELAANHVAFKDLVSGAQENVQLGQLAEKLRQHTQQEPAEQATNEPPATITFAMLRDAYHRRQ